MPSPQLSHVRKRDKRLVPFEPEKIVRSIEAAACSCQCDSNFFSREIAEAVILYLEKKYISAHPSTSDIATAISVILSSLNLDNVASAFQSFQLERENSRLRCTVWKHEQPSLFNSDMGIQVTINSGQRTTSWDRTRIVRALENEAKISRKIAEDIARTVEHKIMASDITRVTTTLIRALTDNELLSRGYTSSLRQLSSVTVPFPDISDFLKDNLEADIVRKTGMQTILPYVLSQIYSEDIAHAYRRGIIHLHGLSHPFFTYEKFLSIDSENKTKREIRTELLNQINKIRSGLISKLLIKIDENFLKAGLEKFIPDICDFATLLDKENSVVFIIEIENIDSILEIFTKITPLSYVKIAFCDSTASVDNLLELYNLGWNISYDKNKKTEIISGKVTINLPQTVYRAHGKDLDGVIEELYRSIELSAQAYRQFVLYHEKHHSAFDNDSFGGLEITGLYEAVSILTGSGVFDSDESLACTRVLLNVLNNGLKQAAKSYNLQMRLISGESNGCGKRFSIIDQSLFPEIFGFLPLQSESLENIIPPYNSFYFKAERYNSHDDFIKVVKKLSSYFDCGTIPIKITIENHDEIKEILSLMIENNCGFSLNAKLKIIQKEKAQENKNQEKFKF
jgi:transcriptional regulator NrdR family protein